MKVSMRSAPWRALVVALAVVGSAGCGSDERPSIMLDGGPTTPGDDGGASTTDDAGPVDPCGGVTEAGTCAGTTARWCEGETIREQDCAASAEVCGSSAGRSRCVTPPPAECADPIEQEQLRITNEERVAAGLGPLVCDPGLTRAARLHSQDMCDQMYFSHTSLDGRTMRNRIDAQDVSWSRIGENIARGQPTPQAVHDAWMDSDGHRANIMNDGYGRIGIGHVACGSRGPYWTQDFAN